MPVFGLETGTACGLAVAIAEGLAGCGGKLVCVLCRFPDSIAPSPAVSGEKLLSIAESDSDLIPLGGDRATPNPASAMVGKDGGAEVGGTRFGKEGAAGCMDLPLTAEDMRLGFNPVAVTGAAGKDEGGGGPTALPGCFGAPTFLTS